MARRARRSHNTVHDAIPATHATQSKMGLPSLALESIKLTARPTFAKFAFGLGTLPLMQQPPAAQPPSMQNAMPAMPIAPIAPTSAGINQIQAQQTPPAESKSDDKTQLILAASTLATSFVQSSQNVQLSPANEARFMDISRKIMTAVESIERSIIDEQDTSIVHANNGAATTIVHGPFLPTEAPVPQGSPLASLLGMAGMAVAGITSALTMGSAWMGTMWTSFSSFMAKQIKTLFDLGWSRVVTGFNMASAWVSSAVGTIMSWVDTSMATVSKWVSTAANQIKSLWSAFDLSKLNILDFNLSGLWAKMQNLEIFGTWGVALKNALSMFGGPALGTLKTVFDVASKVWQFVKPVMKIIGIVAKFMGPLGILFGIVSLADDIANLASDAGAIINARNGDERIAAVGDLISHAMRAIATTILPDWLVDKFLNSKEEDDANVAAKSSGAVAATGSWVPFTASRKIVDAAKLHDLSTDQLKNMVSSGDYSREDENTLKSIIASRETPGAPVQSVPAEPVKASVATSGLKNELIEKLETNNKKLETALSRRHDESWQAEIQNTLSTGTGHLLVRDNGVEITKEKLDEVWSTLTKYLYKQYVVPGKITNEQLIAEVKEGQRRFGLRLARAVNNDIIKHEEERIQEQPMEPVINEITKSPVSSVAIAGEVAENTVNVASAQPALIDSKPDTTAGASAAPPASGAPGPTSGTARAAAAADFATRHAEPKSTGYCARYVRTGLQAAGYKFQQQPMAYQYVTNGTLQKMGFEQVSMDEPPQKGDISVMGPRYQGHAGHISIFNGSNWVSDFVQRRESPYAQITPGQWVTRWRDTGASGNFDPAVMAQYEVSSGESFAHAPDGAGQLSGAMTSILNTALDAMGLRVVNVQRDIQANISSSPKQGDPGIQLDGLLMMNNGFD